MTDLNAKLESTFTKQDEAMSSLREVINSNHESCIKQINDLINQNEQKDKQIQEVINNTNKLIESGEQKDRQINDFMSIMKSAMGYGKLPSSQQSSNDPQGLITQYFVSQQRERSRSRDSLVSEEYQRTKHRIGEETMALDGGTQRK